VPPLADLEKRKNNVRFADSSDSIGEHHGARGFDHPPDYQSGDAFCEEDGVCEGDGF